MIMIYDRVMWTTVLWLVDSLFHYISFTLLLLWQKTMTITFRGVKYGQNVFTEVLAIIDFFLSIWWKRWLTVPLKVQNLRQTTLPSPDMGRGEDWLRDCTLYSSLMVRHNACSAWVVNKESTSKGKICDFFVLSFLKVLKWCSFECWNC